MKGGQKRGRGGMCPNALSLESVDVREFIEMVNIRAKLKIDRDGIDIWRGGGKGICLSI